MFHEFQRPAGMSDEQAFATSFEQVDAAERWGLDAMWLAEIHIAPERSVLSAPLTLASAIAARTKRMKIGTAVQVCRDATRCASPKKSRRSIRSVTGG